MPPPGTPGGTVGTGPPGERTTTVLKGKFKADFTGGSVDNPVPTFKKDAGGGGGDRLGGPFDFGWHKDKPKEKPSGPPGDYPPPSSEVKVASNDPPPPDKSNSRPTPDGDGPDGPVSRGEAMPNPEGGGQGGPASREAMPNPEGGGPVGPSARNAMPNPEGGGPDGPRARGAMPTPDGGGPVGPMSRDALGGVVTTGGAWLDRVAFNAATRINNRER